MADWKSNTSLIYILFTCLFYEMVYDRLQCHYISTLLKENMVWIVPRDAWSCPIVALNTTHCNTTYDIIITTYRYSWIAHIDGLFSQNNYEMWVLQHPVNPTEWKLPGVHTHTNSYTSKLKTVSSAPYHGLYPSLVSHTEHTMLLRHLTGKMLWAIYWICISPTYKSLFPIKKDQLKWKAL